MLYIYKNKQFRSLFEIEPFKQGNIVLSLNVKNLYFFFKNKSLSFLS